MAKKTYETKLLDELEDGPWPSFVTGLKRLAADDDKQYAPMMNDLLGQLEHSYETRRGYWKGGTVSVYGYGGGVIPRFSEVAENYPESSEFHTLRVQPPAGMHYTSDFLRAICDVWEEHGSGLIAFHGQSGDIMFQGCTTENVQKAFDGLNEIGLDMGGAGPALRTSMSCVGHARCEQSCYDEVRAHRTIINAFLDEMHRPALPQRLRQFDPPLRLRGYRHLARRHQGQAGRGQSLRGETRAQVYHRQCHRPLPDQRAEPQRRRHPGDRQSQLRPLHALHQCHDQGAVAG